MVNLWKRYGQKVRSIILLHWGLVTFRFAYGRDRTLFIFMISGFMDVSPSPQTNIMYLWNPQDTSNNPRNPKSCSKKHLLEIMEIQHCCIFAKDGHRTIPAIRLINSRKSWIWDGYLSENMKWQFCNHVNFRNQETKPI